MASTMQLEFDQAMTDFKTMFPDMDVDVIEAILRCNKGAVDATIDQLLAMSTDNQNEKLRHELEPGKGAAANKRNVSHNLKSTSSPINAPLRPHQQQSLGKSQELIPHLSTSPALVSFGSPLAAGGASPKINQKASNLSSRWKPPLLVPLPPSFLRINGLVAGGSRTGGTEQDLPDEQFALMLQNEEFMNELRWNQEFMLALEKEQQGHKAKGDDEAAFRDRVKNMGKMSRKKFQQLAKKFTWQKNKKVGAVRHPDSLLLQEEHSDDDEPRRAGKK